MVILLITRKGQQRVVDLAQPQSLTWTDKYTLAGRLKNLAKALEQTLTSQFLCDTVVLLSGNWL